MQIVPSTGPDDPGHVRAFSDRNSDGRLDATDPVLASFDLPTGVTFEDSAGQARQGLGRGFQPRPRRADRTSRSSWATARSINDGEFRISDPYENYLEVSVEPAATARIEVRKFENGDWVANGDNGKAWTWN